MADHGYAKIIGGTMAWVALITGLRLQSVYQWTPWERHRPHSRQQLTVGFLPVT